MACDRISWPDANIRTLSLQYLGDEPLRIERCFKGMANTVYFLTLPAGRQAVLKICPPSEIPCMASEKNMMAAELEALQLLQNADIPVPSILGRDPSAQPAFFFMSHLPGQRFSEITDRLSPEENAGIRFQIGRLSRRIHRVHGGHFGFRGNPYLQSDSWKKLMLMLFSAQLEDGARIGCELPFVTFDALRRLIFDLSDVFDEVTEPCLNHGDLWDGNVLVQNGTVTGIIDFERACFADGLMENGFANYGTPDVNFLRGYGKTAFTRNEKIRCSLYRLSLYLGMSVGHCYRNDRQNTQPFWMLESFERELNNIQTL